MKLAHLLLKAFGPFTDAELNFTGNGGHPSPNLHLIYGPNEAGKSSALRAMTDLRFGIPMQSSDSFLHPPSQLRIAGIFIAPDGSPIGLVRRKGRGITLTRFDPVTGEPSTPPDVSREYEMALTGGLERDEFEAMFGLNHARLRQGGNLLLKGEGELGSALFEASAGTRGIAAILDSLEADAKALFNPHGRTQSATINEARGQIDDQRQLWKQAQTRPADWQDLHRAHETARESLAEVERNLEVLRRRENELTELRTVEPLLREHDRALSELQSLVGVSALPENAREERLAAEQALRRAEMDVIDAEQELSRCSEALAALVIESPLLEHAETIEKLAASLSVVARSRVEMSQQQVLIKKIEADMSESAARIAAGKTFNDLVKVVPSSADRAALDANLVAISSLSDLLEVYRNQVAELEEGARIDEGETPELPDPYARQALLIAIRNARSLGDVSRQISNLDREIQILDGQLNQASSDIGVTSADELRIVKPVLDTQISNEQTKLAELNQAEGKLYDEDKRIKADLEQQLLRQREFAAEGEVVTGETLLRAREHRDAGWSLIRQAYIEHTHDAHELGMAFDPKQPLPEAFEEAQSNADRQADLLRADAARAVGYEECTARIAGMDKRRREIDDELANIDKQRQVINSGWDRLLKDSRLPDLNPEELREWQTNRKAALDIADRLNQFGLEKRRLLNEMTTTSAALTSALQGVGQTVVSSALQPLIDQADRWEKQATRDETNHEAKVKSKQQRRLDQGRVNSHISNTEEELKAHETALQHWHARLLLPMGSPPVAVKGRLAELDELARQFSVLGDERFKFSQQKAVVDDFEGQASDLARILGEEMAGVPDDFVERVTRRLKSSREQEQLRRTLSSESTRANEAKNKGDAEQKTQAAILARLCQAAGVEIAAQLPEVEDNAARKRSAQAALATNKQQLAKASTCKEEELRERLTGLDTIAIDSERERCRVDISQGELDLSKARETEEQTRRALQSIDSSDAAAKAREAVESAAARFRSAILPWARLKVAHALLREALNRFRERAQAPMVATASTYFSLITGGRYLRLVADESTEKPVLRAERSDGVSIGVEGMSEGTADQLYLALRLAALELRRASHPQMPLILDDVLVTSDDERAANILRALAKFAEDGQVMVFTHHRHLVELANSVLGEQGLRVHDL